MRERQGSVGAARVGLPQDLRAEVERAGYYPALVCDVLDELAATGGAPLGPDTRDTTAKQVAQMTARFPIPYYP